MDKMHVQHSQEGGIKQLLLGRTVTKVNEDTLELDDGTLLEIIPNEGCGGCRNGYYAITELNDCPNNAIMNVEFEQIDVEGPHSYCDIETTYRIFVLAEDTRIKLLEVEGTDGNGYYGSGYWIDVKTPEVT